MASKTAVAYIRWFDSAIIRGECTEEDATGYVEMESAGLLIREDKDSVTIVLDRVTDNGNLRSMLCIPRVNIRSVKKIKV